MALLDALAGTPNAAQPLPWLLTAGQPGPDQLRAAAAKLREKLATFDGVFQIEDTFRPGKNELRVTLKPEAHALGLTTSSFVRFLAAHPTVWREAAAIRERIGMPKLQPPR